MYEWVYVVVVEMICVNIIVVVVFDIVIHNVGCLGWQKEGGCWRGHIEFVMFGENELVVLFIASYGQQQ